MWHTRKETIMNNFPPIIPEEYWVNSQLSIARYYGLAKINGEVYVVVDKHGISLLELSNPKSKHYVKEGFVIPPKEPADLVSGKWLPMYRKLGRGRLIELIKEGKTLEEVKKIAKKGDE